MANFTDDRMSGIAGIISIGVGQVLDQEESKALGTGLKDAFRRKLNEKIGEVCEARGVEPIGLVSFLNKFSAKKVKPIKRF